MLSADAFGAFEEAGGGVASAADLAVVAVGRWFQETVLVEGGAWRRRANSLPWDNCLRCAAPETNRNHNLRLRLMSRICGLGQLSSLGPLRPLRCAGLRLR